jgi:uncharacterized membrane protein YgcG
MTKENTPATSRDDLPTPGVNELMASKETEASSGRLALKFGIVAAGIAATLGLAATAGVNTYNFVRDLTNPNGAASIMDTVSTVATAITAASVTTIAATRPFMRAARYLADRIVPEETPQVDAFADKATELTMHTAMVTSAVSGIAGAGSVLSPFNTAVGIGAAGAGVVIESKAGGYAEAPNPNDFEGKGGRGAGVGSGMDYGTGGFGSFSRGGGSFGL